MKTCFQYVVKYGQTLSATAEGSIKLSEGGEVITINKPPTGETVKLIIPLIGMFDVMCSFLSLLLVQDVV